MLDSVQPILDGARKAVSGISVAHLNEIRSLPVPPPIIRDVLEGVLRLLGSDDTTWEGILSNVIVNILTDEFFRNASFLG